MEDVYYILYLVRDSSGRHILLDPRDQGADGTFLLSLSNQWITGANGSVGVLQLEELDDIFKAPNPRKASTEKKKLALDANANVVDVQTA